MTIDPTNPKTCSVCGETKQRLDFPMYKTGPYAGQTSGGKCKGCYAAHVRTKRQSSNPRGPVKRVSLELKQGFCTYYTARNKTPNQIGKLYGFSGETVKYHLKAAGIKIKPARFWYGPVKLSAEDRKRKDREASNRHKASRKRRAQEYAKTFLDKGCIQCSEKRLVCLDFDHRDPDDKEYDVGKLIGKGNVAKLKTEIAKCDVVCKNCHAVRTATTFGSWRLLLI